MRQHGRPDHSSACAMSVDVVVLPFVPVTPMTYMPFTGLPERVCANIHRDQWYATRRGLLSPTHCRKNCRIFIMECSIEK